MLGGVSVRTPAPAHCSLSWPGSMQRAGDARAGASAGHHQPLHRPVTLGRAVPEDRNTRVAPPAAPASVAMRGQQRPGYARHCDVGCVRAVERPPWWTDARMMPGCALCAMPSSRVSRQSEDGGHSKGLGPRVVSVLRVLTARARFRRYAIVSTSLSREFPPATMRTSRFAREEVASSFTSDSFAAPFTEVPRFVASPHLLTNYYSAMAGRRELERTPAHAEYSDGLTFACLREPEDPVGP